MQKKEWNIWQRLLFIYFKYCYKWLFEYCKFIIYSIYNDIFTISEKINLKPKSWNLWSSTISSIYSTGTYLEKRRERKSVQDYFKWKEEKKSSLKLAV